ncbi:MAG: CopG family transcriptional regulator [Rhodoglobus sp.]
MRTTVDLPDELFHQLKARAIEENLSLKLLVEKSAYQYLRQPLKKLGVDDVILPTVGDGSGEVLVDPTRWWDAINDRA